MFGGNQQQKSRSDNDPFSRIADSDPAASSAYPEAGLYPLLFVDVLKMIRSRKGDDVFIAELDILESNVASRPKGTRMGWAVNFRHDAAPGNVKSFLAAAFNVDVEDIDKEGVKEALSDSNPAHGRLVRLEATDIKTKAGNPFTRCNWSPVPKDLQDKADELREQAGFTS